MAIHFHKGDLPDSFAPADIVAIDCEMMGLVTYRDRLCLVQLSNGDGDAHLVQIARDQVEAPNLVKILEDPKIEKLFHFGRADIAVLAHRFGVITAPIFDTKIASKLARTYTDSHGLASLVGELLGIELSKAQQSSDWGVDDITDEQRQYAAADVLHLHALRDRLIKMLTREERYVHAQAAFDYLPHRVQLDLAGWGNVDIFAH